jgi:adenylate kinase family enzyme
MGASGSGTTTLGAALARRLGCPHHDADDYFWLPTPTDPPFTEARPPSARLERLCAALAESGD